MATETDKRGNRQSYLLLKTNALLRHVLIGNFRKIFPLYIVTEHPKSGGTWVSQMISDYLQIPFQRNKMPIFGTQVMHCHRIGLKNTKNVFVVLRDGRDVMVSYYYHSFFYNDLYNARHVDLLKKYITFQDNHNIRENLPRFIEYLFSDNKYPRMSWGDFVLAWIERDAAFIRYENLLKDCAGEMGQSLAKVTNQPLNMDRLRLIAEKYSFRNQAKRKSGEESKSSWLRKGISGDWKNVFTKEARQVFHHVAGDALILLGYEQDGSWV